MSSVTPRSDGNRSAILAHVGAYGTASRAELARRLDLSPGLITRLTRELIADGLLEEREHTASAGGRPAQQLGLTSTSIGAIGVKIAPDHITAVEVGIDGLVCRATTTRFDATSSMALSDLTRTVVSFTEGAEHETLLGIGVGLPGNVREPSEKIVDSTQLGWAQIPLGSALRSSTHLPVLIDNNVNVLALAEQLFGAGRGRNDFLVVTIGTGIGAGIVTGGSVVRGDSGSAGEIGHIPAIEGGPVCQCGARGCLEAVVGQTALVDRARERGIIGPHAGIVALHSAADAGDHAATQLFEEAGHLLGRAVAGVVNTIDPEVIVVLGEGADAWRHWSFGFEPAMRAALIPRKRGIEVIVEGWHDDRWAQGAASLVLSTPFDADGTSGEQGRLVRERLLDSAPGSHQ